MIVCQRESLCRLQDGLRPFSVRVEIQFSSPFKGRSIGCPSAMSDFEQKFVAPLSGSDLSLIWERI